jgi:hypothetical protein
VPPQSLHRSVGGGVELLVQGQQLGQALKVSPRSGRRGPDDPDGEPGCTAPGPPALHSWSHSTCTLGSRCRSSGSQIAVTINVYSEASSGDTREALRKLRDRLGASDGCCTSLLYST